MPQAHRESWCLENPHTCTHLSIQLHRIFMMLHHCCCWEASSIICTLWDSVTMGCFHLHLNIQVCPSLYWSPLQGDAQWWASSYTEQHIEERQWFLWLWEEKRRSRRPKGEVLNNIMGEIKSRVKKEFGKSKQIKQASKRKVEKKLGGMSMTQEHEVFTLT